MTAQNDIRDRRGGFALLVILMGAAVFAVLLARSLPRDAMSAQRVREETLVMRGEEYARAIELYFRDQKKYPERLRDLEETDGVRYLRRRYKDPLTGEDEWRLIRMGADGRFKDSLIYDTEEEEEQQPGGPTGSFSSGGLSRRRPNMQAVSSYAAVGQFQGAERARAVRETAAPDALQRAQGAQGEVVGGEGDDAQAQGESPNPGQTPVVGDFSRVRPGNVPANAGRVIPNPSTGPVEDFPSSGFPVAATGRGAAATGRGRAQNRNSGVSAVPGATPDFPQGFPGGTPGAAAGLAGQPGLGGEAANVIQRLLTTPRPGGLAGLRAAQGAQQAGATQFQEGIAGVASKSSETGVKRYKGKEKHNEWEFVYDYRKDAAAAGGALGAGGMSIDQVNSALSAQQPGTSGAGGLGAIPSGAVGGFGAASAPGTLAPGVAPDGPQSDPFGAQPPPFGQPADGTPPLPAPPDGQPPFGRGRTGPQLPAETIDPNTGLPYIGAPGADGGQPQPSAPTSRRRRIGDR